jgi:hypothetical protein
MFDGGLSSLPVATTGSEGPKKSSHVPWLDGGGGLVEELEGRVHGDTRVRGGVVDEEEDDATCRIGGSGGGGGQSAGSKK